MALIIYYHRTLKKRISKVENTFPNISLYSLMVSKEFLKPNMKSEDLAMRFLNTDNIVQTALSRDFGNLHNDMDKMYYIDRKVKQMEIDLSGADHFAKSKGCMKRASPEKLEKLKSDFNEQAEACLKYKFKFDDLIDYPTSIAFITFATQRSKHKYLSEYLKILQDKQEVPDKFKVEGKELYFRDAEDPRNYNYRNPVKDDSRKKKRIAICIILVVAILLIPILLYLISLGVQVAAPQPCVNSKDLYTSLSMVNTGSSSSTITECLCAFQSQSENLSR